MFSKIKYLFFTSVEFTIFLQECVLFFLRRNVHCLILRTLSVMIFVALFFQVCQELADVQANRALIEAVMDETKQLQEVGGYPFYRLSQ
jgi:hypothetical protein